jgi:hypothetical protein
MPQVATVLGHARVIGKRHVNAALCFPFFCSPNTIGYCDGYYSQFNKKRNILTLLCFPKHRVIRFAKATPTTPLNALSMFWK